MNVAKSIPKDFPFCSDNTSVETCVNRVIAIRLLTIAVCIVIIVTVVIYSTKHYNLSNKTVDIRGVTYTCVPTGHNSYKLMWQNKYVGTMVASDNSYQYTVVLFGDPDQSFAHKYI
jgi:predicted nucleic acid-binding Zn ribbon protein